MTSFALRFQCLEGAFARKRILNRCLGQPANVPRNRWISTVKDAKLWYLKPLHLYQTEKPYHINLPANALGSHAQSNEVSEEYAGIQIEDLRGFENDFTLDKNGFQIFQDTDCSNSSVCSTYGTSAVPTSDFYDDPDLVRKYYYPTIERFLKEKLKAQLVKPFTHEVWLPLSRLLISAETLMIGSSKRAAISSSASWHRERTSAGPGRSYRQAAFSRPFRGVTNVDYQTLLLGGRKRSFTCFFPLKKRVD